MKPKLIYFTLLFCALFTTAFGQANSDQENRSSRNEIIKKERSVSIFTPDGIEFIVKHVERAYKPNKVSFFDIWHLWEAYENIEGERIQKILQSGEWETAIKTKAGFVGGALHGYERKKSVRFYLDGELLDEDALVSRSPFNTFTIVQVSDLYAYNSVSEKIAEVTKRWEFGGENEIKLKQEVHWLKAVSLETAYLSMFPVMRENKVTQVSTHATRNDVSEVVDVSESGEVPFIGSDDKSSETNSMQVWGDKYLFELNVEREQRLPNSSIWLWAPKQYNKMYFDYCGEYDVTLGEVFEVASTYTIRRAISIKANSLD